MKKIVFTVCALACICIALLLVACKEESTQTVSPNGNATYTVSFVSTDIECTLPEAMQVKGGESVNAPLPTVSGLAEYYTLAWFTDEAQTKLYKNEAILGDTVFYLGLAPKSYSLTYEYDESISFTGEFPTSYTFGESTPLPICKSTPKGYYPQAKWVYGDGEEDFFTTAVSDSVYGDLTLKLVMEPIQYKIFYNMGEDKNGNAMVATHNNPTEYTIDLGEITLAPAETETEGYVFSHWSYWTSGQDPLFGTKVEKLNYDFILNHSFTLVAQWIAQ